MNISVREILGERIHAEDAIILREYIEERLSDNIELDFEGMDRVPTTFLTCLFTNLINKEGRDCIINKISVKNLSNYRDYLRVVRGTTFS